MQFNSFIILILLKTIEVASGTTADTVNSDVGKPSKALSNGGAGHTSIDASGPVSDKNSGDHYEYRHVVAEAVQKALNECRDKFKWDRWNCPKKAFYDILDRNTLPSNKELGLTRALIASGIVLSVARSCSYGLNSNDFSCRCSPPTSLGQLTINGQPPAPGSKEDNTHAIVSSPHTVPQDKHQSRKPSHHKHATLHGGGHQHLRHLTNSSGADTSSKVHFDRGCDDSVRFAFQVSKSWLDHTDSQYIQQDEASRRINEHNYEAGRLAVKNGMKRECKCHGVSGGCSIKTCWKIVPDMNRVGDYLRRQYRLAAKVGAMSAEETNIASLNQELTTIQKEKLVFADASPDYCYEDTRFGINGTLGRYCSRTKYRADGTAVSRSESSSCDRLCTKCGYKIKRERLNVERQCNCRFVYCCSVECKLCPHTEDTYRCVRHS